VEEELGADREEFTRILRRVRIDPRLLAALDLLDEIVIGRLKHVRPCRGAHITVQRRHSVDRAVQQIELVRELVSDDVVAFPLPARLDVFHARITGPKSQDSPLRTSSPTCTTPASSTCSRPGTTNSPRYTITEGKPS